MNEQKPRILSSTSALEMSFPVVKCLQWVAKRP